MRQEKIDKLVKQELSIVYEVTATAVLTAGTYDGVMTEETWRQWLVSNKENFSIEWTILEVQTDSGLVVAASGQGDSA